ncbi:uncharacterized protein LOC136087214 [Hydra vulgaris]|uniref:Uncharacterized protein LOC136087214 n=1 Tax=Hydra vulgaris TaxID=6087 RepID=A0ABM4CV38_HYDVU
MTIGSILYRFEQQGYAMIQKVEPELINVSSEGNSINNEVLDFYATDLNASRLHAQLQVMHESTTQPLDTLQKVLIFVREANEVEKESLSEIKKLIKLNLLISATDATSKRAFNTLRRIKTWLRSTMNQARLNWCMLLNIHIKKTDELNIIDIANDFCSRSEG